MRTNSRTNLILLFYKNSKLLRKTRERLDTSLDWVKTKKLCSWKLNLRNDLRSSLLNKYNSEKVYSHQFEVKVIIKMKRTSMFFIEKTRFIIEDLKVTNNIPLIVSSRALLRYLYLCSNTSQIQTQFRVSINRKPQLTDVFEDMFSTFSFETRNFENFENSLKFTYYFERFKRFNMK